MSARRVFFALALLLSGCGTPAGAAVTLESGPSVLAKKSGDHAAHLRAHAQKLGSGALPSGLHGTFRPHRVVLLGEIHGTQEFPKLAYETVRLFVRSQQPVFFVVELPTSEQAALDRFRVSGDAAELAGMPFFKRAEQDGRSSRAIAELLGRVRALPDVPIVAYDSTLSGQARETAMAETLAAALEAHPGRTAVVLTGNVHAMRQVGLPWDAKLRPMAHELEHAEEPAVKPSEVIAVKCWFESGSAWMGGPAGVTELPKQDSAYTKAVPWSSYFAKEPRRTEGFDAVFFQRKLTPSQPLVK